MRASDWRPGRLIITELFGLALLALALTWPLDARIGEDLRMAGATDFGAAVSVLMVALISALFRRALVAPVAAKRLQTARGVSATAFVVTTVAVIGVANEVVATASLAYTGLGAELLAAGVMTTVVVWRHCGETAGAVTGSLAILVCLLSFLDGGSSSIHEGLLGAALGVCAAGTYAATPLHTQLAMAVLMAHRQFLSWCDRWLMFDASTHADRAERFNRP